MTNWSEEIGEATIDKPFMRSDPLTVSLDSPREPLPEVVLRDGRGAVRGEPALFYFTFGPKAREAALVESVRCAKRQLPTSVGRGTRNRELYARTVRITSFSAPWMRAVDTTTPRARARFGLPESCVGDGGGPREWAPYQRMVGEIRADGVQAIVMDSAAMVGARTLLLSRPVVLGLRSIPGQDRAIAIPREVIDYVLDR